MAKISIIVPVYNVEAYLALSIQSARDQSYDEIEIVCVNDGSPDECGSILKLAARVDSRIVVVEKENGGLSSARNAGLDAATGDYVCFLDSDDLLVSNACETIVAAFEKTGADVVTYGGYPYPEIGGYPWLEDVLSPRYAEYRHCDRKLLFEEKSSPFVWRTACRLSFLRESGLRFDESLPYGEDQVFQFQLYPRSSHTVLVPDKLVRYRVSRPGSFMASRLPSPSRMAADHVAIVKRVLDDWFKTGVLNQFLFDALDWAAEFVMLRVFQLEEEDEQPLLDPLKDVLVRCFDEQMLAHYVASGVGGGFVDAIVFNRSRATGGARRRIVHRYLAKTIGKRYVLKMLVGRVVWDGPWGKLLAVAKGRFNAGRDEARKAQWDEWERCDEAMRREALERLRGTL